MAGNPNYREERVLAGSPEEEQVKANYEAQGWKLENRVDDGAALGYVRLMFRKPE
jgi:hypothetical protein